MSRPLKYKYQKHYTKNKYIQQDHYYMNHSQKLKVITMTSLFVVESFSFSFRASRFSFFSFFSFFSLSFSFLDYVLSFSVLIAIWKTEG